MSLFDLFWPRPKPTAVAAKERLQILLTHERSSLTQPDYLPRLHRELLQVIAKYIDVDEDKISFEFANAGSVSMLGVNIELPNRDFSRRAVA
jgi:cell division topological specificity factor